MMKQYTGMFLAGPQQGRVVTYASPFAVEHVVEEFPARVYADVGAGGLEAEVPEVGRREYFYVSAFGRGWWVPVERVRGKGLEEEGAEIVMDMLVSCLMRETRR